MLTILIILGVLNWGTVMGVILWPEVMQHRAAARYHKVANPNNTFNTEKHLMPATTPKPVNLQVTPVQAILLLQSINQLLGLWQSQKIATTKFVLAPGVKELTTFRNDLAALLKGRGLS